MNKTKKMVYAAICLALCMVLPFLTGQIPQIGKAVSPLHIPVLICGFICGWPLAAVIGFVAPVLRFLLFGMPPIFPTGAAMMFELATYGFVSGILYKYLYINLHGKMQNKNIIIYPALVIAMLCGRIVWGIAMFIFIGLQHGAFTWQMFIAGAFIDAVPGIIIHIAFIPLIVMALRKAGLAE